MQTTCCRGHFVRHNLKCLWLRWQSSYKESIEHIYRLTKKKKLRLVECFGCFTYNY